MNTQSAIIIFIIGAVCGWCYRRIWRFFFKPKGGFIHITHGLEGKVGYAYSLFAEDFCKKIAQNDESAIEDCKKHYMQNFSKFVEKIRKEFA